MRTPRKIRYTDEDFETRDGIELERNGSLTLVEDEDTGEVDWKSPFEVDRSVDD